MLVWRVRKVFSNGAAKEVDAIIPDSLSGGLPPTPLNASQAASPVWQARSLDSREQCLLTCQTSISTSHHDARDAPVPYIKTLPKHSSMNLNELRPWEIQPRARVQVELNPVVPRYPNFGSWWMSLPDRDSRWQVRLQSFQATMKSVEIIITSNGKYGEIIDGDHEFPLKLKLNSASCNRNAGPEIIDVFHNRASKIENYT
jgi:hypothetical protein